MALTRIGVIASPHLTDARFSHEGVGLLESTQSIVYDPLAAKLLQKKPTDIAHFNVDAAIVFGGDGTLLHAVHQLPDPTTPLLGVNTGSVGFLSETTPSEFTHACQLLLDEAYTVEDRTKLAIEDAPHDALNEVAIYPQGRPTLLQFDVAVNDAPTLLFAADGLLVTTPTGSTAHALSAGGPVIDPRAPVLAIVPLNPFRRQQSPVVVPDDATLTVTSLTDDTPLALYTDGHLESTPNPDLPLTIKKSSTPARFIRLARTPP